MTAARLTVTFDAREVEPRGRIGEGFARRARGHSTEGPVELVAACT